MFSGLSDYTACKNTRQYATIQREEEDSMFYDDVYRVCNEKGTKPTIVLRELNLSTGNISKWKGGTSPSVKIATRIAEHLGVSLSYLCNPSDILEYSAADEDQCDEREQRMDNDSSENI